MVNPNKSVYFDPELGLTQWERGLKYLMASANEILESWWWVWCGKICPLKHKHAQDC